MLPNLFLYFHWKSGENNKYTSIIRLQKGGFIIQLEPEERSILAYFSSNDSAQKASEELKAKGYNTVQVDRISRYGVNNNPEINSAIAGNASSNTGLSLYSSEAGDISVNERILLGSDPSVSGYGSNDYGIAGGKAFLVTVVTNEGSVEQATKILKKHGAKI